MKRLMNDDDMIAVAGGKYTGPAFVYVFQQSDNLAVLAQRIGTTVRTLWELNGISEPSGLEVGTRILIPQR